MLSLVYDGGANPPASYQVTWDVKSGVQCFLKQYIFCGTLTPSHITLIGSGRMFEDVEKDPDYYCKKCRVYLDDVGFLMGGEGRQKNLRQCPKCKKIVISDSI